MALEVSTMPLAGDLIDDLAVILREIFKKVSDLNFKFPV